MAESEEELKSLLMKVKRGEWKSWLKTQHSKDKDHGIQTRHPEKWGNNGNSARHSFLGLQKSLKTLALLCNKGSYSQSYGFSSGHVWMWELDYKENWAPKNWRFWTVVLKKTLESPLGCKEIKPVLPKGFPFLKEISPKYSLEGLMLKLKLQ